MNATEEIADAILNRWHLCQTGYGYDFFETENPKEELMEIIKKELLKIISN